ncbi:hypothetical protein RM545_04970 [Zunongwangia sp. F260]|uniref:Uncharacterized protein n=1 Tax=Autumnicola lenta TaxID=3075593 RepID=A0ABU3CI62_9FLAO|nr:hypothetical protein [Zunongwangia sp. F260]MDT0646034.1 hypothetical protein [Zunongwangia sp. F260]
MERAAAKLDVKIARADFYPSFKIEAKEGFQAFDPAYLIEPESLLYKPYWRGYGSANQQKCNKSGL